MRKTQKVERGEELHDIVPPSKIVLAYEMLRSGKKLTDVAKILDIENHDTLKKIQQEALSSDIISSYKSIENALIKKACGHSSEETIYLYTPEIDENGQPEIDENGEPKLVLREVRKKVFDVPPDPNAIKTFLLAQGDLYDPKKKDVSLGDNVETVFDRFDIALDDQIKQKETQ